MAGFTDEILEIFANCMSGVESGGQIYGNGTWDSLILQYTNSRNEHAITIGAFQKMGVMAKGLLLRIRREYPDVFKKYDTAGIGTDLDNFGNWARYQLSSTACAKAKAIRAIIGTPEGIKVQKLLMAEEAKANADKIEDTYGVHRIDALLHLANVVHLGGMAPLERILSRILGEVTLEKVRDSLLQDNVRNQVGAEPYRSRQRIMYQWIHEKITPLLNAKGLVDDEEKEVTQMGVTAGQVLEVMRGWVGLSRSKGTHKPIIDLYNSHRPLARGYAVTYKDDYCDTTVSAAFIKLGAADLIGGTECGVEEHINLFKKAGIWQEDGTVVPEPGHIICYNWDDGTQPNDGWADHIGIVESVNRSAGTFVVIEGNTNGGIVGRRTVKVGWGYIRGYAIPRYAAASGKTDQETGKVTENSPSETRGGTYMFSVGTVQNGSKGNDVKLLQRLLKSNGFKGKDKKALSIDGDAGANTVYAIKKYQKKNGLTVDGVAGAATWKSILMR